MPNELIEQSNNKPWLFKKGQSGNPAGRPKGTKSLKTYAKEMIEKMTEEERQEYLDGLPKSFIWEMAEGKAKSNDDIKLTGDLVVNIAESVQKKYANPTSSSTKSSS